MVNQQRLPGRHPLFRRALSLSFGLLVGACATPTPLPAPDILRAVCMSHEYLDTNGFLRTRPKDEKKISLLNTDLRYEEGGEMNYPRLLKERHNRFTRKLAGVWVTPGFTKYLVSYGPIDGTQHCVGVTEAFEFAYLKAGCQGEGTFLPLRDASALCRRMNPRDPGVIPPRKSQI